MPPPNITWDSRFAFHGRPEVVALLPSGVNSLLDVGCSEGQFGIEVRSSFPDIELVGVEPDAVAAAKAATHYDEVLVTSFPDCLTAVHRQFDVVVFNDVLEHMSDPWEALLETQKVLKPHGKVVASIPNIRFLPVIGRLALFGEFTYVGRGVLDWTHLRFFTRRSIREMFDHSGYTIEHIEGALIWRGRSWLSRVLPRAVRDVMFGQLLVIARVKYEGAG